MKTMKYLNQRNITFVLFSVLAFLMAFFSIEELYTSASNREYCSHIVLIPFVSLYFFTRKKRLCLLPRQTCMPIGDGFIIR